MKRYYRITTLSNVTGIKYRHIINACKNLSLFVKCGKVDIRDFSILLNYLKDKEEKLIKTSNEKLEQLNKLL